MKTKFRRPVIECMDLLFRLHDTMIDDHVTIDELSEIMRMAIASGHDSMAITLSMASIALERSK